MLLLLTKPLVGMERDMEGRRGGEFTGCQNAFLQEEIVKLQFAEICFVGHNLGCLDANQTTKHLVFFSLVIYEIFKYWFPLYSLVYIN